MFASIFRAVFPTMHASTPQRASDVEAQVSTDIFTPFNVAEAAPAPPPAAFTVERSRSIAHIRTSSEPTQNAVDLFFGVSSASTTSSRGTVESCHDLRPVASNSSSKDQPPAYVYPIAANINEFGVEELPTYAQTFGVDLSRRADADDEKEPASLAMYLFKFGFLCPILWFLSVFIFVSPLVAPADWEESKTPAQREMLLARMRASELRWAKRSLFAAFVFCVVVAVIVSLVVVTHH